MDLVRLYETDQMSTTELSALTGQPHSGIYATLRRHGAALRTRGEGSRLRPGGAPEHHKIDLAELHTLHTAGMSIPRIAAELACSVPTIKYHLDNLATGR